MKIREIGKIGGFVACLAICLALCPRAEAGPLPLEELILKMQEAYDAAADVKSQFIQDTVIKSMNKKQREEGVVYYKKPQRMLWDYARPKVKKLIITSTKAWLYIPQDNTVYVQDADRIFKSQLTVRFLSGIGSLRDDFDVAYAPENAMDDQGNYRLALKGKSTDIGVSQLRMIVDKDSYQIIQCNFTDMYGNATQIQFRNMKINTAIPDRLFHFKPPEKAEVFPMQ